MTNRPNDTCSRCGKAVYRRPSSRPEIVCRVCRRASSNYRYPVACTGGCGKSMSGPTPMCHECRRKRRPQLQMKRPNTYGKTHQALRKRRVAAHKPGDPCSMGGEPLWQDVTQLDLAHDHVNGGYLPGLSCAYHNRAEGAERANRDRVPALFPLPRNGVCKTCGAVGKARPRKCEICGAHYHPSYSKGSSKQRTCGRKCGAVLQQRNRPPSPPKPTYTQVCYFNCKQCGKLCAAKKTSGPPRALCGQPGCLAEYKRKAALAHYYRNLDKYTVMARAAYYRKMGATEQQATDLAAGKRVAGFTAVKPTRAGKRQRDMINGTLWSADTQDVARDRTSEPERSSSPTLTPAGFADIEAREQLTMW